MFSLLLQCVIDLLCYVIQFETITIVREGKVDHFDSLKATARFGGGGSDTQWVTTGSGMSHSEMFSLTNADKPNPLVLFQVGR